MAHMLPNSLDILLACDDAYIEGITDELHKILNNPRITVSGRDTVVEDFTYDHDLVILARSTAEGQSCNAIADRILHITRHPAIFIRCGNTGCVEGYGRVFFFKKTSDLFALLQQAFVHESLRAI